MAGPRRRRSSEPRTLTELTRTRTGLTRTLPAEERFRGCSDSCPIDMYAEINVTPLVDVCLVLLIIFMVVLPAMVNDVQLPESAYGTELEKRIFPVTVKN